MTIKSFFANFGYYVLGDPNINIFATVVRTLETHPDWQRIAWYKGYNGTGLTGRYLEPGSSGPGAFAVYRAINTSNNKPFDFVISWSDNFALNPQPNGRWTNYGESGVGFAMAYHTSSVAWGGTTFNDGTDSFDTSSINEPWKANSFVFPRDNGVDGGNQITRNTITNTFYITPVSFSPGAIYTIIGTITNNSIMIAQSGNGRATVNNFFYAGNYQPITSSIVAPFLMMSSLTLGGGNGGVSGYITGSVKIGSFSPNYSANGFPGPWTNYDAYFNGEDRNIITEHPGIVYATESPYFRNLGIVTEFNCVSPNAPHMCFYNHNSRLILAYVGLPGIQAMSIPFDSTTIQQNYM